MKEHDLSAAPGRTYRYYTGPLLFPFGYGLSYQWSSAFLARRSDGRPPPPGLRFLVGGTMDGGGGRGTRRPRPHTTFNLSRGAGWPAAARVGAAAGSAAAFTINVANTGGRGGDEVVQAYYQPPAAAGVPLRRQLFDFKRVRVGTGGV
eukprot:gene684-2654_t